MNDQLSIIYEDNRLLLISTGRIEENISEIQNLRVKYRLSEMIKTVQADLMISIEFIYEVMQCDTENEIESLLERFNQQNDMDN
jgi:HAMP domain-containing protein